MAKTAAYRLGARSCVPGAPHPIVAIEIHGWALAGRGAIDERPIASRH